MYLIPIKKTGEFYIVEIKSESDREDKMAQAKAKAVERLQKMQPDRFKYHIVYTSGSQINGLRLKPVIDWIIS